MKEAVISFSKYTTTTAMASARIAKFVAETIGADLIDRPGGGIKRYDRVYCANGLFLFCDFREDAIRVWNGARERIWLQNDYTLEPPPKFDERHATWTTIPSYVTTPRDRYINWNSLTWKKLPAVKPRVPGLFYYGAWRKGREAYFKTYLGAFSGYDVHVSSSVRAAPHFAAMNPTATIYRPFKLMKQMQDFTATVYIEDAYTHSNYCSPANRFYECVAAHLPMAFDHNTIPTFQRANIDVGPYVVRDNHDVKNFLKDHDHHRRFQQKTWDRDYRAEARADLLQLHRELK